MPVDLDFDVDARDVVLALTEVPKYIYAAKEAFASPKLSQAKVVNGLKVAITAVQLLKLTNKKSKVLNQSIIVLMGLIIAVVLYDVFAPLEWPRFEGGGAADESE